MSSTVASGSTYRSMARILATAAVWSIAGADRKRQRIPAEGQRDRRWRKLTKVDERLRDRVLVQTELANILDDADDLNRIGAAAGVDMCSNRVVAQEAAARHGLADEHHSRLSGTVGLGESAAVAEGEGWARGV
jgi:hypothetical protein